MCFRWFIYYCAMGGGCAAYVGWLLGRLVGVEGSIGLAVLRGVCVGMMIGLVLGLLDALWNGSGSGAKRFVPQGVVSLLVGCLGGAFGGLIGQALYGWSQLSFFLILGWLLTGLLVGASVGVFELLSCVLRGQETRGARRKMTHGLLGGTVGGFLGGICFLILRSAWDAVLGDRRESFWSPGTTGFIVLGLCIGLLIGLTQVLLKEAWLTVEAGFRSGRQTMLSRPIISIGRAEACDIGLFGDAQIDKVHCRIVRQGDNFILTDEGSATGTYVNEERVSGPRLLRSGDLVRVGRAMLRFRERLTATALLPSPPPPPVTRTS
jgi:hypothetical protein